MLVLGQSLIYWAVYPNRDTLLCYSNDLFLNSVAMWPTVAHVSLSPQALRHEEQRDKEMDEVLATDERKRPYHSMRAEEGRVPTEEEMEAYRLKRRRQDDPMAAFT